MTALTALIAAISSLVGTASVLVTAVTILHRQAAHTRQLADVAGEVATSNGKTIGALLDLQEGRRIVADIPEHERTDSEHHYVHQLTANSPPAPAVPPVAP